MLFRSVGLDTMCSSALVSIHQGCLAIRNGDCDVAVAGGVNVTSHPAKYLQLAWRGFLSEDGRCRSFGAGGTGYVPSEGSGAVLLKRLDAAVADGDRILAVVKGSAVNHGGTGRGFNVPNPNAQGDLLRSALDRAGLRPADLDYVEAHGTGTSLGDPVEIAGMMQAFRGEALPQRLPIGSVKSNIGHAESAAGVAAVAKVLLQMRHGELVPSLHADELNPNIDFDRTPFEVQREAAPWPRRTAPDGTARPRTAGVSAFGAGGTNACVILQEFMAEPLPTVTSGGPHLAVFSAREPDRLALQAQRLADHLRRVPVAAADLAWTLQSGREAMAHRLAVLFTDVPGLIARLTEIAAGVTPAGVWTGVVDPRRPEPAGSVPAAPAAYGKAWTTGLAVDWASLYPGARPNRVSLPGYPFGGDRVWLAAADAEPASPSGRKVLLAKRWTPAAVSPVDAVPGSTAILAPPGTEALAARLAAVLPAAEILLEGMLAAEVAADRFAAVVDLAGCAVTDHSALSDAVAGLQRIVDAGRPDLRLVFVSRGVSSPAAASRAALYRMLQSEYRHVRSRHVHVGDVSDDRLCGWVVEELQDADELSEVDYQDGARHRAELRELTGTPPTGPAGPAVPAGQVLWITGGTRGIGLLTARHFVARHGVRKLVLTGRDELPPRDTWGAHIAAGTALGRKLRPLAELAEQGVQLDVRALALDDPAAVSAALAEVRHTLGPVGGLIHSAGVVDPGVPAFVRKSWAGVERVLNPKTRGLDTLIECFREEPLQLFVLFSSVAAAVPALAAGQSDYAMANAYLDAVAQARPYGLPLVSVQWTSWQDTGMGAARSAAYQASGLALLTDADGLDLLDRALASGERVVLPTVVSPEADWQPQRLTDRRLGAARRPSRTADRPAPGIEDRGTATAGVAGWLLDQVALELRFDRAKLAGDVPLHEYGIDSVLIAQLQQDLGKRLDVSIDPSALLEHPSADEFAVYLGQEHPAACAAVFGAPRAIVEPVVAAAAARVTAPAASEVAVIGLSCTFPGAASAQEYWDLLRRGDSALRPVPDSRFGRPLGYHAGLLPDVLRFDPDMFLLAEDDVRAMDPQALLLLDEVRRAVYHSGYRPEELKGRRVGVYVGGRSGHLPEAGRLERARNLVVATGQNYLSANISQFFDLRGPSLVIDTACSSALVAMDMARQALASGEIESALVAGVSLLSDDRAYQVFDQRGLLSPSAEFHVFDRRAGGLILGEGLGVVVLKSLERARADGDRVLAVLRGIAINNDGRTAGPATPNLQAQKEVMREALARGGLRPQDVGWVEVNGSGSTVTDLLELKAIDAVYGGERPDRVALGSIKPNIGHPLAAEGIASFIKVALMLHHGEQVPFRSGQQALEHFDLAASPLRLPRRNDPWPTPATLAAINCFADGGTNAHLLLAPAPSDIRSVRAPLTVPPGNSRTVIRGRTDPPGSGAGLFWESYR